MERVAAVFLILLGVNFLLKNFGYPGFSLGWIWKLWPLLLVWVGVTMWRDSRRGRDDRARGEE